MYTKKEPATIWEFLLVCLEDRDVPLYEVSRECVYGQFPTWETNTNVCTERQKRISRVLDLPPSVLDEVRVRHTRYTDQELADSWLDKYGKA